MKRALIIGFGSIAKRHITNINTLYPQCIIDVVSSRGILLASQLEDVNFFTQISSAVEYQPDFAIVASPATFHFKHAKALLSANVPVLIEKPITACTDEARELLHIIQQSNTSASVAYCLRYLSSAKVIKKMIEDKKIGNIYNVAAHVGQYLPSWRHDKKYQDSVSASNNLGGGVLLELSHELDYLQWILGKLFFHYAVLRNTNELSLDVEEIADVFLATASGTICSVHMNFIQKKAQRFCYFIGEKGHIYWDLMSNSIALHLDNNPIIFDDSLWDKNNMYLLMLQEFIEQIKKQKKDNDVLLDAYQTVALIEQIKKNAVWGKTQ